MLQQLFQNMDVHLAQVFIKIFPNCILRAWIVI